MRTYFITDGDTIWRVSAETPDIAMVSSYFGVESKKPRRFIHRAPLMSKYAVFTPDRGKEYSDFVTKNVEAVHQAMLSLCEVRFPKTWKDPNGGKDAPVWECIEGKFDPSIVPCEVLRIINQSPV